MIFKTMTFKGFDDTEYTETFYFHLSEAELTELEASRDGGLSAEITKITKAEKVGDAIEIFKRVIDMSYGKLTADKKGFMKSPEILAEFKATQAYSDLFIQLSTDPNEGARFINGLMPAGMAEKLAEREAAQNAGLVEKTPSQLARERSEAQMQGHQAPHQPASQYQPQVAQPVQNQGASEVQASPPIQQPAPTEPPLREGEVPGQPWPPSQAGTPSPYENIEQASQRPHEGNAPQ